MRIRNVERRQLGAWLFAGLAAPLAQFAGGMPWTTVVFWGLISLTASWAVGRLEIVPGKWLCVVEFLWIVFVMAGACRWISGSWAAGNAYPAVPLILLALGAASSFRGAENAARAGSIVFWLVALIYSAVAVAGVSEVDIRELTIVSAKWDARLVTVCLIPSLTMFLPQKEKGVAVPAMAGILAFAVLLSALVTGTLSLGVAESTEAPLHEWVKGLSLAGTLQRFEAVVSVALTMGWFALLSFALSIVGQLMENIKAGGYGKGIWTAALAAATLTVADKHLQPEILALGSAVLWVAVPAVTALLARKKN